MKEEASSRVRPPAVYHLEYWKAPLSEREDQVFLALTIVIGALAGLAVVAFLLLTERLGARLYPPGVSAWRRLFGPMAAHASPRGALVVEVECRLLVVGPFTR
jgi:uncharacterized membrane protein YhhN